MDKIKLSQEFKNIGYGLKYMSAFSKEAQNYIVNRHNRGIAELKQRGEYPKNTGDNGYTPLLGVWQYTKSKGLDCAIGIKTVWMASILNDPLI